MPAVRVNLRSFEQVEHRTHRQPTPAPSVRSSGAVTEPMDAPRQALSSRLSAPTSSPRLTAQLLPTQAKSLLDGRGCSLSGSRKCILSLIFSTLACDPCLSLSTVFVCLSADFFNGSNEIDTSNLPYSVSSHSPPTQNGQTEPSSNRQNPSLPCPRNTPGDKAGRSCDVSGPTALVFLKLAPLMVFDPDLQRFHCGAFTGS